MARRSASVIGGTSPFYPFDLGEGVFLAWIGRPSTCGFESVSVQSGEFVGWNRLPVAKSALTRRLVVWRGYQGAAWWYSSRCGAARGQDGHLRW